MVPSVKRSGVLVDWDPFLTADERQEALAGQTGVCVLVQGKRGNVLRDRKFLLRYMRALMGDDGVSSLDHVGQRFWSRQALDEELSHDADLDVTSIHVLHTITADEEKSDQESEVVWVHSHGLAEIGFLDFDILKPSADVLGRGNDALRAIALALVEGKVTGTVASFPLAHPGGDVRFVEIGDFLRKAPADVLALRQADKDHNVKRLVLCEPEGKLLGRWFGKVRPSRFLSQEAPDEMLVRFSSEATELMAERARATYSVFRALAAEFAELELPVLAKLGYVIDGGKEDEKEHLWFEVHDAKDGRLDATLGNDPFHIARMKQGQRDWHDLERMTDWTILTPLGPINPRSLLPARIIRDHWDEFVKIARETRNDQGS